MGPVPIPFPPVFFPGTPGNKAFVDSTTTAFDALRNGALDNIYLAKQKATGKGSKPDNCPTGTLPIDQAKGPFCLDKDDIHTIKKGLGAGNQDWVGIAPNGDIITTEDGEAVNNGPLDSYLP